MTDSQRTVFEQTVDVMADAVFASEVIGPLDALVDEQPVRDILTAGLRAALDFVPTKVIEYDAMGSDCDVVPDPNAPRLMFGKPSVGHWVDPTSPPRLYVEVDVQPTETGEA